MANRTDVFFFTRRALILTSLVKVLLDVCWSVAYFGSGDFLRDNRAVDLESLGPWQAAPFFTKALSPLVVILPLWWRFMQVGPPYRRRS
jgi:hypothetical protein